jgi:hypothetical protein
MFKRRDAYKIGLSLRCSQDAVARTVKQRTEKDIAPSAAQSKPVSEPSYEGCEHSKSGDA